MSGREISFTKMEGCGNDYIYIDGARFHIPDSEKPELIRRLSDRHFGIGGDGVIFINPAPEGMDDVDLEMEMYNLDGSRGEMCGNGIRCVGAYAYVRGLTDKTELVVVSAGARKILTLDASEENGQRSVRSVTVDMGAPILEPEKVPADISQFAADDISVTQGLTAAVMRVGGTDYRTAFVSMGNPHAVVFLPDDVDLAAFPLDEIGPLFETHPVFPRKTNTEFVHVDGKNEVHMRVWERGSGETLACGTGCCATTVACTLAGLTEGAVRVHVKGGELECRLDREKDTVWMTGPATFVFDGVISI